MQAHPGYLPEPYHTWLTACGYITGATGAYRFYYEARLILEALRSEAIFTLSGPKLNPTHVTLHAPHLAGRSRLLTYLLSGGPAGPLNPLHQQDRWWIDAFEPLPAEQRAALVAPAPDGITFALSTLPHGAWIRLLTALGRLGRSFPWDGEGVLPRHYLSVKLVNNGYWLIRHGEDLDIRDREVHLYACRLEDLPSEMAYWHHVYKLPFTPLSAVPTNAGTG